MQIAPLNEPAVQSRLRNQASASASLSGFLLPSDVSWAQSPILQRSSAPTRRIEYRGKMPLIDNNAATLAAIISQLGEPVGRPKQADVAPRPVAKPGADRMDWTRLGVTILRGSIYTDWGDGHLSVRYRVLAGVWTVGMLAGITVFIVEGQSLYLLASALAVLATFRCAEWARKLRRSKWN